MSNIPIRDIPGAVGTPNKSTLLAMDDGISMQKTTVQAVVEAGRPIASEATARAGIDNSDAMSALRVAQAIETLSITKAEAAQVRADADAAAASAATAAGSAGTATGAASTAQTSAGQAMSFRNGAESARDAAAVSASQAEAAKVAAEEARDLAAGWAEAARADIASKEEAEAGTATNRLMTPLGVSQRIEILFGNSTMSIPLKASNTAADNSTLITAAIAAYPEKKQIVLPKGTFALTSANFTGAREVRGQGEDTIFDFSGRSSSGSLVTVSGGGLDATAYAATADCSYSDTWKIAETTDFDAATFRAPITAWVSSDAKEFAAASTRFAEHVEVIKAETAGGTTTLKFKQPTSLAYLTTDSAKIQKTTLHEPIDIIGVSLKGTGNTYVSNPPLNADGDQGFVFNWVKKAGVYRCVSRYAERNAYRFNNCPYFDAEQNFAEFNDEVTTAQIQYGFSCIGAYERGRIWNNRGYNGRHFLDVKGGGQGMAKLAITGHNLAESTYEEAFNQHDLVGEWISTNDTARRCQGGFGIRSRARIYSPTVKDCYSGNGGVAFQIVDVADAQIFNPDVDNVRFFIDARNETGTVSNADNTAPVRIKVVGGEVKRATYGLYASQKGVANAGSGYNTTPIGEINVEGTKFDRRSGPREAPTSATRSISVEGYCDKLVAKDVDVTYTGGVTSPYVAVQALGTTEVHVSGGRYDGTNGVRIDAQGGNLNAVGASVTLTPARVFVPRAPTLVNHVSGQPWLASSLNRATVPFILPAPITLWGAPPAISHTGTTAETVKLSIPLPIGLVGRRGYIEGEICWSYTNSANNKTLRGKIGGVTFLQTTVNSTAFSRHSFRIENRDYNSQAAQPTNLITFGTNSGSAFTAAIDLRTATDLTFTVELANTGETVIIEAYSVKLYPG